MDFLLLTSNLPFTIALGLMLGIGVVEIAGTLLGFGFSSALDAMIPDLDFNLGDAVEVAGVDGDFDATNLPGPEGVWRVLAWLQVGRVPVIVILLLMLTSFGLLGLLIQWFTLQSLGFVWPAWAAWAPAFLICLPVVRVSARTLARVLPKDETEAVASDSFVGRVAVITIGTAAAGKPAEAKLRDQHGQTHYVMVVPDVEDQTFPAGSSVILVSRQGGTFRAISNTHQALQE